MEYKRELKALLQDPSLQLSYEQIWKMMDDELAKPTEKVDQELVEECIQALSELREAMKAEERAERAADTSIPDGRRRARRRKRLIAVLVAVVMLTVSACMIPAKIFSRNADGSLVEYLADCVRVNLNGGKNLKPVVVEELRSELAAHGFEDVLLPESYLPQCQMAEPVYEEDDLRSWVKMDLIDGASSIEIRIFRWKNISMFVPMDIEGDASEVEQFTIDNIPGIVVNTGDQRSIYLENGVVSYIISTAHDMNIAMQIAQDLK